MSKPLAIALPVAFAVLASLSEAPRAADRPPAIPPCPSDADKPDVAALIKRIDRLLTGRSSVVVMTMSITTPSWRGTLKLKVWAEGKDYALVRVLDGGPRETGMMTLKREKQLWNWRPGSRTRPPELTGDDQPREGCRDRGGEAQDRRARRADRTAYRKH